MTSGVGGKTVYQPMKVDNNSKAAPGTDQSGAGRGNFGPPGPNVTWVSGVVKTDAETMAKREAFISQGAMGMHQAVKVTVDSAAQLSAPVVTIGEEPSASSDDSTSGVGDIVEEAAKSSEAALKAEEKHDDEVAARRTQELKDLHQDMQLSTTGTTAPAA
jgi:hypothetical protein